MADPHSSFRTMKLVPSYRDLFEAPSELAKNIVGSRYTSAESYLSVHFRLLLEDFMEPLRSSVKFYIDNHHQHGERHRYDNMNVYYKVKVSDFSSRKGDYIMRFSTEGLGKIDWEASRRLIHGSLLLLTADHFKTVIFATVTESRPSSLANGVLSLCPVGTIPVDFRRKTFIMAEAPAFFEPYRAALANLQFITTVTFPFMKYFLAWRLKPETPRYLSSDSVFKLGQSVCSFFDLTSWPPASSLGLDESQYDALRMALTREIALIQGPPGTGKTYVGLKIVQALLQNETLWRNEQHPAPLVVLCYTNHAVDQFLEGILSFTSDVIRIGSQSKSEALKRFTLRANRRRWGVQYNEELLKCNRKVLNVLRELAETRDMYENLDIGLLHENTLLDSGVMDPEIHAIFLRFQAFSEGAFLPYWLCWDSDTILNYSRDTFPFQNNIQFSMQNLSEFKPLSPKFSRGFEKEILLLSRLSSLRSMARDAEEIEHVEFVQNHLRKGVALRRNLLTNLVPAETSVVESLAQSLVQSPLALRWQVYAYWKQQLQSLLKGKIELLEHQLKEFIQKKADVQCRENAAICRRAKVVGMTTCGAAKNKTLLDLLQPKIVIVEEAAEVLEAHILASLPWECQHLILIGDHQQLRPSTSSHRMAKDYHLDISLFERWIKCGIEHCTLEVQHRMRPEVARLISPAIYSTLKNHDSVLNRPDVRGVNKSVFFWTHREKEVFSQEGKSFINPNEASMALKLARYLCTQGYHQSSITVLTTYSGQLNYLEKLRSSTFLHDMKFCTVDNYQGEENDIIILSLVRNNDRGSIGFLSSPNRVCVALSRARVGFYILGNMTLLADQSSLWNNIKQVMERYGETGSSLELYCTQHDVETKVSRADDFPASGNCNQSCNKELPCGHACASKCHKSSHDDVLCRSETLRAFPCGHLEKAECNLKGNQLKCPRKLEATLDCGHSISYLCGEGPRTAYCSELVQTTLPCGHATRVACSSDGSYVTRCSQPCTKINKRCSNPEKHRCDKLCYESCGPCDVPVEKILPCGHTAMVKCSVDPSASGHNCKELVRMSGLLRCGHNIFAECTLSKTELSEETKEELCLNCEEPCKEELECGHECRANCGTCFNGSIHAPCMDTCNRLLICGHRCPAPCSAVCPPCRMPCPKRCQHKRQCQEICSNECSKCQEPCLWVCEHLQCTRLCWEPCNREKCDYPCRKKLDCSHDCLGFCSEPCPPICAWCKPDEFLKIYKNLSTINSKNLLVYLSDCGHNVPASLLDPLMEISCNPGETAPVRAFLCPSCQVPIKNCQRYSKALRNHFYHLSAVKALSFPADSVEHLVSSIKTDLECDFNDLSIMRNPKVVEFFNRKSSAAAYYDRDYRFFARVVSQIITLLKQLFLKIKTSTNNSYVSFSSQYPVREVHFSHLRKRCAILLQHLFARSILREDDYDEFVSEVERFSYLGCYYNMLSQAQSEHKYDHYKHMFEELYGIITETLPLDERSSRRLLAKLRIRLLTFPEEVHLERSEILKEIGFCDGNWLQCGCGNVFRVSEKCAFCFGIVV